MGQRQPLYAPADLQIQQDGPPAGARGPTVLEALPRVLKDRLRRGRLQRTANHCIGNAGLDSSSHAVSSKRSARPGCPGRAQITGRPAAPPSRSITNRGSRLPSGCPSPTLGLEEHVVDQVSRSRGSDMANGCRFSLGLIGKRPPHAAKAQVEAVRSRNRETTGDGRAKARTPLAARAHRRLAGTEAGRAGRPHQSAKDNLTRRPERGTSASTALLQAGPWQPAAAVSPNSALQGHEQFPGQGPNQGAQGGPALLRAEGALRSRPSWLAAWSRAPGEPAAMAYGTSPSSRGTRARSSPDRLGAATHPRLCAPRGSRAMAE